MLFIISVVIGMIICIVLSQIILYPYYFVKNRLRLFLYENFKIDLLLKEEKEYWGLIPKVLIPEIVSSQETQAWLQHLETQALCERYRAIQKRRKRYE